MNVILTGGGVLCLAAAVYVVYRHGFMSEGQTQSMPTISYLIPTLMSVLLFASLWLRPTIKIGLTLILFSVGFSLYLSELILVARQRSWDRSGRTLWTPNTREDLQDLVRIARKAGVTYDTRAKFHVVTELRPVDPGVIPAVVARALLMPRTDGTLRSRITLDGQEVVVLGGISREKTVFCNESGEWVTYTSDEHGFHNPAGIWQRGKIDIVILGDSFAQGGCVPSDKNSAALIRRRFPATLNLGMLGSGPLIELAQLEEYVTTLKPQVVLWFFYEGNDFGDLDNERNSRLLMSYLEGDFNQQLISRQPELDEALQKYVAAEMDNYVAAQTKNPQPAKERGEPEKRGDIKITLPKALFLTNLRRTLRMAFQARGETRDDDRVMSEEAMELLRRIFVTAKATVDEWGGALYLVYVPERDRYAGRGTSKPDEMNHRKVLELARALEIPVIDIHPVLQAHDDPLSLYPFRRRGHFNEDGYRLIAETILQSISYSPGSATESTMSTRSDGRLDSTTTSRALSSRPSVTP